MDVSAIIWLVSALGAGLGLVVYLIATDKQRFLVRFDLRQWREPYYLRALPNFLQALHNHSFRTAWPARLNAVSAAYFRFRAWPLLKGRPATLRRAFLQQHITLFGLLETLRPFLHDFMLNQQQRIVGERVLQMEDTSDRDRLIAFIDEVREQRARFYASLTSYDRDALAQMVERRFIEKLQAAHAIFQEHGFSLMEEFTQLRRWREMSGTELVQELPELAPERRKRRLARRKEREARELA